MRARERCGRTCAARSSGCSTTPGRSQFVENFAGQWLQLRKLAAVAPDKDLFPGFDAALRDAMRQETEPCFAYILRNDRSVLELLDADYTFVNEPLARHYGIEGVTGDEFRRVALTDGRRGGVLTQASVLTLTSNPNRTSPVKRGQWILQQLLGTPPPPPPADVAKLDESRQAAEAASLRERMEVHRTNPEMRLVPSADGPARVRPRELRRRGPLAVARTGRFRSIPREP